MNSLRVIRIRSLVDFKETKHEWENLYKYDPNAQLFISWSWVFNYLVSASSDWLILGVKNDKTSAFVAFLPIQFSKYGLRGIYSLHKIDYLGKPHSIYPGFLCLPDFEDEAIHLLGTYVQSELTWDILHFNWIRDPRIDVFMATFDKRKFDVAAGGNQKALRIQLPGTFQDYLDNYFGRVSRRMIKRRMKHVQSNQNYKITYSTSTTLQTDVDALNGLWNARWQRKSEAEWNGKTLIEYFNTGLLRLSILWDETSPVSALACLLDPEKKTWYAFITSHDPSYSKIAPGIVLFADSIKKAIEEKYKIYDFTVGTDAYKQLFGPDEFETQNISIKRNNFKTLWILRIVKSLKRLPR